MKATEFAESAGILKRSPKERVFEVKHARGRCRYEDESACFRNTRREFGCQYFHVYLARLNLMKDVLLKRAESKWGTGVKYTTLAELQDPGEKCIIVGTIIKRQELKPSVLKEISDELQVTPQQKQTVFISENDELVLEDELQRIRLIGDIDLHSVVNGVVCAILGSQDENGKFVVQDTCMSGPQQIPKTLRPTAEDKYLLLLSGADLAHSGDLLPLQNCIDWITGFLGDPDEQAAASKISLVLIAGNLLSSISNVYDGKILNTKIDSSAEPVKTAQLADDLLSELVGSVNVDLMPGEFDPTNCQLPQQPLHFAMFPKASKFSSFHGATNPHKCTVEGRLILGSSGQPVSDVGRYSNITDPLAALEATFRWGHVAPTAPDTLNSYPYYDKDPFIIDCQPDVYFTSNHDKYQTKMIEMSYGSGVRRNTRLVVVPSFCKTKTVVMVNLSNLDCHPVSFNCF